MSLGVLAVVFVSGACSSTPRGESTPAASTPPTTTRTVSPVPSLPQARVTIGDTVLSTIAGWRRLRGEVVAEVSPCGRRQTVKWQQLHAVEFDPRGSRLDEFHEVAFLYTSARKARAGYAERLRTSTACRSFTPTAPRAASPPSTVYVRRTHLQRVGEPSYQLATKDWNHVGEPWDCLQSVTRRGPAILWAGYCRFHRPKPAVATRFIRRAVTRFSMMATQIAKS
jgi:hypothetical protein